MPAIDLDDRYEFIGAPLRGGMGQVWRARDKRLERPVAVKQIHPAVLNSDEDKEEYGRRFRREARLTAQIRHPGVPQVFDAVIDEDDPSELYLVMEWVDGQPIDAFYGPDRPLHVDWATSIAAQIAAVLSHAHAVPAVHRDLKPGNVILTPDGTVKVLDFGIAALLRGDVSPLTGPGPQPGTLQYMPPEQLRGVNVSPRSDLYALGCILYEMLAGSPAFSGSSPEEVMYKQLDMMPPLLTKLRREVPAGVAELTQRLLAKNPDDRPEDAEAVYNALAPFLPEALTAGKAVPEPGPAVPSDPTLMYRRPNAPRPQTRTSVPALSGGTVDVVWPAAATAPDRREAREAIGHAGRLAISLFEDDRPDQAAQVLDDVIARTIEILGSDDKDIRDVRRSYAHTLYEDKDFRRALREFEVLAEANERLDGLDSPDAIDCRLHAARCKAALARNAEALADFRTVYGRLRDADGDLSKLAVEVRRDIAMALLASDETDTALETLDNLQRDLSVAYSPDDIRWLEIEALIQQIRSLPS